jgi:hypothetical protein
VDELLVNGASCISAVEAEVSATGASSGLIIKFF